MIANIITMCNAVCGVWALLFWIKWNFLISWILIICWALFDFLDWKIARKLKQTSLIWAQLDSFSDLISFVIAPAVLLFFKYLDFQRYSILVVLMFILCWVWRLARFNVKSNQKNKTTDFEWLPTTFSWIFLSLILIFFDSLNYLIVISLLMILGILMISNLKIKKI